MLLIRHQPPDLHQHAKEQSKQGDGAADGEPSAFLRGQFDDIDILDRLITEEVELIGFAIAARALELFSCDLRLRCNLFVSRRQRDVARE